MQALVFTQLKCEALKSAAGIIEGLPASWKAEGVSRKWKRIFLINFSLPDSLWTMWDVDIARRENFLSR